MCDDNGKPFIDTLYNVLLAPELCDRLFSIITLMNLGYTWLFHKGFCRFFFSDNEHNEVKLTNSAQRKHELLVKTKEESKSQKRIPQNKVSLEILHWRLGHIFKKVTTGLRYCKCLERYWAKGRSWPILHIM